MAYGGHIENLGVFVEMEKAIHQVMPFVHCPRSGKLHNETVDN